MRVWHLDRGAWRPFMPITERRLTPMKRISALVLTPLFFTGGCALEASHSRAVDGAFVMTQVSPQQVAECIAQTAGTTATAGGDGAFAVDVPGQASSTRLTVTRDKVQTIVAGPADTQVPPAVEKIAVDCVLKLTPPAH